MVETTARTPRDLRVATPANWFDLDLEPATSEASIERLVAQRAGDGSEQAEVRAQLVGLLRRATSDAVARGAVFASLLSDVIGGRPVAASLIVSVAADTEDAGGGDLQALVERLRRSPGSDGELAQVGVVELPAAPAVRLRRRTATEPEGDAEGAVVETVQYFVPVPATASLLVLSFSTPNLALAEAFVELFDTMAHTLQWRW